MENKGPSANISNASANSAGNNTFSMHGKPEMITEKFLAVAKEKNQLESIIIQQDEQIRRLQNENSHILASLKKFTDSNRKLKEKLLDFDLLRNMEVSELRKKIEQLMAENRQLMSAKDEILKNFDRDRQNMAMRDSGHSTDMTDKIIGHDASADDLASRLREAILDRDEARAELYNAKAEFEQMRARKNEAEEELNNKINLYSKEISALKTDIDELTTSVEQKIRYIDELKAKVKSLSDELTLRDAELHEKVPALLEKINSLSQSIESKMEENSLFAKELFDLNVKISSLNDEIFQKDEFLLEISESYKKQKEEIEALHGAHELTLRNLVAERDALNKVVIGLQVKQDSLNKTIESLSIEKSMLKQNLEVATKAAEIKKEEAAALTEDITRKNSLIKELQKNISELQIRNEEVVAALHAETDALNSTITSLNAEIKSKDEEVERLNAEIVSLRKQMITETSEAMMSIEALRNELSVSEKNKISAEEKASEYCTEISRANEMIAQLKEDSLKAIEKGSQLVIENEELKAEISGKNSEILSLQSEIDSLQGEIEKKNEEFKTLEAELSEKDASLVAYTAEIGTLRSTLKENQKKAEILEQELLRLKDATGTTDTERSELLRQSAEYQETFEHLKKEIIALNKKLAEEELASASLRAENESLSFELAKVKSSLQQISSMNETLKQRIGEIEAYSRDIACEKERIEKATAAMQEEKKSYEIEKELEIQRLKGETSAYGQALADMRSLFEHAQQERNELFKKLIEAGKNIPSPPSDETTPGKTLPATVVVVKEPGHRKTCLIYTLIAILFISLAGFGFYTYNRGIIPISPNKASKNVPTEDVAYNDMLEMLTKTGASDDLKIKAVLMTEPLVRKSELPDDIKLYDFKKNIYFKVSINSPINGLDAEIAEDPYHFLMMPTASGNITSAPGKIKQMKTFYRKAEPVSVTFYCAFPVASLNADAVDLRIVMNKGKINIPLVWDMKRLKAAHII